MYRLDKFTRTDTRFIRTRVKELIQDDNILVNQEGESFL